MASCQYLITYTPNGVLICQSVYTFIWDFFWKELFPYRAHSKQCLLFCRLFSLGVRLNQTFYKEIAYILNVYKYIYRNINIHILTYINIFLHDEKHFQKIHGFVCLIKCTRAKKVIITFSRIKQLWCASVFQKKQYIYLHTENSVE